MDKEKKNHSKTIIATVAVLILLGASFYGGTVYAKTQSTRGFMGANGGGQFTAGQRAGTGMRSMGGFTAGEIISKDDTSMTLKMPDGSTKIVLMGSTTKVTKSTDGSLTDLAVGTNVTVTGTPNSDKSVTATSVEIRPAKQPALPTE